MALKKLVKVKMLVDTAYQGPRRVGDVVSVPEDFANRWVKNKIAELLGEGETEDDVTPDTPDSENEDSEANDPVDGSENEDESQEEVPGVEEMYNAMTAKELYELCKEQGIEVEAKKSKAYYIEKLKATEE